ncbi:MAG: sulfatase-like hydrolase/transferase [Chitinophagaceae bacterium]|nr:sulfatase-like hydrolase/transferase [Chitinophagaceae bacterium]
MHLLKKTIVLIFLLLLCAGILFAQQKAPKSAFKNVIFIVSDDHTASVLGAYGNKLIRTPNLDRMAQRGILFEHAYANAPLCSPSRQSVLTGKYPHATGVSLLQSSFPEEQVTIADHLSAIGFKTAIIGKNHFNNALNHGFELKIERKDYVKHLEENPPALLPDTVKVRPEWRPFKDPANIWLNAEGLPSATYDKDQAGTYFANKAVEYIRENKDDRFLLWVGFEEPHSPYNFPIEYANKYNPKDITLPVGSPEDDRWIPEIFRGLTDEEKKGIIASYYSSVEFMDKNVGLILDAVEKSGLSENTLVVYIGDNGYLLNDHKRFEKHTMWEQAVRVPLIIQAGNKFGKDRRVSALTEFVDLVPTAIDALGVKPLATAQGKSFLPVLGKQSDRYKDFVFSEYLEDNKVMIRTERWKYVFTSGKKDLALGYATGYPPPGRLHFLYDLTADPGETRNAINDPDKKSIVRDLQHKLIALFEKTHPKGKLPDHLSIDEKLEIYSDPPELAAKK